MLTPTDVQRLLAEHGLAPHKSLGQNFVVDANTVRKVVRDAGVQPGDLVVEIGPGLGSLTLALREAGAHVIAVEIDAGLVRALRTVADDDVEIVHADALRVDFVELLGGRAASLVANLPYNVATPIVMTALASGAFESLFVMVQKEVAQRWVARVGDAAYGGVSVKLAALAQTSIVAAVSRHAFHPVPNVDSATVRLTRRPWSLAVPADVLFSVVDAGFSQRRKRLRNSLTSGGWTPGQAEAALARAGLDPGARAEELDVDHWAALAGQLRA